MITYFKIIKIIQGDIKRYKKKGNEEMVNELESLLAMIMVTVEPFINFLKADCDPKLYAFMNAYFFEDSTSVKAGYIAGEYGVGDNVRTYFKRACERYDSIHKV